MNALEQFFAHIIAWCYTLCGNYVAAMVLFTLLVKLVLLPLSVWVQKNAVRMVAMTPKVNRIRARYFGMREIISEETYRVYKEAHYSPFLDLVPLIVQILLLFVIAGAVRISTPFVQIPFEVKGDALLIPLFAALSALLMCMVQNRFHPLQAEQSRLNRYSTLILSVLLSLYLGLFVASGLGFYWICSNLFSALQVPLLNVLIDPKKAVDYADLEESKKELEEAKRYAESGRKKQDHSAYKEKEKEDYKRFLKAGKKRLVFHAEKNGFYKYFQDVIEEIIAQTNIVIHYVTQDPEDAVFQLASEQFKPYYISEYRLIVLMMKLECEIFVTTTPELENYHLKRSYVDKEIEYIYLPHDVNSANLTFRKDALDHFDTIFVSGKSNRAEIREREERFHLPEKNLVDFGSGVIDRMAAAFAARNGQKGETDNRTQDSADSKKPAVLIAPSWQKDNILDLCAEELLNQLKADYRVTVRPHPQYVRHFEERIDRLADAFAGEDMVFQKDFSSNETVYTADLLITDWSSIAFEYAFATLKPVLFINTPMKVLNPDWKELKTVPIDIELRDQVGISIEPDALSEGGAVKAVDNLLHENRFSQAAIASLRDSYLYHVGESGKAGASYIIQKLVERSSR